MTLYRKIVLAIGFLGMAFTAAAQETKPPVTEVEGKISEEIEIIKAYKPILADAVKLRRSPDLDALKLKIVAQTFELPENKLETNTDIQKLQAQQLARIKVVDPKNSYAKLGFGNLATINTEAYLAMGKDPALQTGIFFKHLSQQGKLFKQNENRQQLSGFARSIGENNTYNAKINYERHGIYFYAADTSSLFSNPNPERQIFSFFEGELEALSKFTPDPDAFSYGLKLNGYLFNDSFTAKEKTLSISAFLNKRIKSFNLGVAASTDFGNTKDLSYNYANNLLRLNPYIKLQSGGVKIVAGINMVQEFGSRSSSRFFPKATADLTLIGDFLQIFAEVKGDVKRNSLKDFSDENPFINRNIFMKNSVEKFNVSAGIKGTGGPGFGYKAKIYQKQLTDMPLFVNNFNTPAKFDVIYDFGTSRVLGLEGELSVQVSDNLKWTGQLVMEDYKAASEKESYYKPKMRLNSNFTFVYNKKVTFEAALALQDNSWAKVYLADTQMMGYYPPIPDFTKEKVVTIKGFVELGLGVNYQINNKFGAYIKTNNTLNSNYNRFLYYRANGFNIFGGLTYSF